MMEDSDLAAIRAKRLAELQAQKAARGGAGGASNRPMSGEDAAAQEAQKSQMEEMRRSMLAQLLDNSARERLNRISIVKPDKARAVEELIIRMARTGQIAGRINESQLIDLLEQLRSTTEVAEPKIEIRRRRMDESDDEEEYNF